MPLTRPDVVTGALALLDEAGLEGLTMRRLAQSLGVQAGAIYYHFKDKQDLYSAIVETGFVGLLEPAPEGTWQERLAELSRRLARAMLRHRDSARLATLATRPGPHGLAYHEAMLRTARESGLPPEVSGWAIAAVGYFVLGYVTDVQALDAFRRGGQLAELLAFTKELASADYPEMHALMGSQKKLKEMASERAFQARFEFGLQVLINGLSLTEPPAPPRPSRRRKGGI